MKSRSLKYLLLSLLALILLSGCIIIVEKRYYPERTIERLGNAVITYDNPTARSCFAYNVNVISLDKNQIWTASQAANYFTFEYYPYENPTFDFYNITVTRSGDYATFRGRLYMKGLRNDNWFHEITGYITFRLIRISGDNWLINGLDLGELNDLKVEYWQPKSIE